jgi:hypothetical protein
MTSTAQKEQESPSNNTTSLIPAEPSTSTLRQSPSQILAVSLLRTCHDLLSEITLLQTHLSQLRKPSLVEVRAFKSVVQSELKSLEKHAQSDAEQQLQQQPAGKLKGDTREDNVRRGNPADGSEEEGDDDDESSQLTPAEGRLLHALRSSNLPFYATVWSVSKTMCTHVVGYAKRFHWYEVKGRNRIRGGGTTGEDDMGPLESDFQSLQTSADAGKEFRTGRKKKSCLVDIVADNGEEWVKVSTITPTRLLFELAKLGWEAGWNPKTGQRDDEEYSDDDYNTRLQHSDSEGEDSDDDDRIELVKLASDMKKAAALVRIRYKHPRIRIVLPKIAEGQIPELDRIIQEIRNTGATVQCCGAPASSAAGETNHEIPSRPITPVPVESVLSSLLPVQCPHRTETLNIDCTLLLALVSDLSHFRTIEHSPAHHRAITRQIELEAEQPLVPSELWPAMGDKALVCTQEASLRMKDIVDLIGTETEKARTALLMGERGSKADRDALISQFQALSDHNVPADWNIPIQVVDAHAEIARGWDSGRLPGLARKIAANLSDINTSVFLYGWASGHLTLSSNRTVVKQIDGWIEEYRDGDEDIVGPGLWVCDTARSLIGKEANRRG